MSAALSIDQQLEQVSQTAPRRMCRLHLHEGYGRNLTLKWFQGKGYAHETYKLEPGKNFVTDLGRAQAEFGMFTIPTLIADISDERKKIALMEQWKREADRAILRWGDYPRPQKPSEGMQALGPARLPWIIATVIEADGSEWDPIDIREQYGLGQYVFVDTNPQAQTFAARQEQAKEVEREEESAQDMRERLARTEGMLAALMAAGFGQEKHNARSPKEGSLK